MAKKKSKPAKRASKGLVTPSSRRSLVKSSGSSSGVKSSAGQAGAGRSGARRPPAKVHTEFVRAFVAEFIGGPAPGTWKWPVAGQQPASVAEDFQTFANTLVQAGYLQTPPTSGPTGSLHDRIENFLILQSWPGHSPIPVRWQGIQPTVRLIEISQIIDHLLQAMNAHCSKDGTTSQWPPH